MNEDKGFEGSEILGLLRGGLDTERLEKDAPEKEMLDLYEEAERLIIENPKLAIEYCEKGLDIFKESPFTISLRYRRGMFYLLLGCIYLNQWGEYQNNESEGNLQDAKDNFVASKNEFSTRKWLHLESLALLGLATTHRKMSKFQRAAAIIRDAHETLSQEATRIASISGHAVKSLREAIDKENGKINQSFRPDVESDEAKAGEAELPIFKITSGQHHITTDGITNLNLLSYNDYQGLAGGYYDKAMIDLDLFPVARDADYILDIGSANVEQGSNISQHDWLFIQDQNTPDQLYGKIFAILMTDNDGCTTVHLRSCITAEDPYFLKSRLKSQRSIIVVNPKSPRLQVSDLTSVFRESKTIKRADDIQVSGVVLDHISSNSKQKIVKEYKWQLPIINDIPESLVQPFSKRYIRGFSTLKKFKPNYPDHFILSVKDNDLKDDGIYMGDRVLIRQEEKASQGDIAAIIITEAGKEPISILRKYYFKKGFTDQHWFLKASNRLAQHLVVIPESSDVDSVKQMYKNFGKDQVKFYENAELTLAGVFIEIIEES